MCTYCLEFKKVFLCVFFTLHTYFWFLKFLSTYDHNVRCTYINIEILSANFENSKVLPRVVFYSTKICTYLPTYNIISCWMDCFLRFHHLQIGTYVPPGVSDGMSLEISLLFDSVYTEGNHNWTFAHSFLSKLFYFSFIHIRKSYFRYRQMIDLFKYLLSVQE